MAEQSEQRQRYGYTDESGNRVSALRDMFNGGGPGQSGTTFQGGGALSSLGNALGGPAMFGGGDGINMGRVAGSAIGGMALGPVGGLLGGLIGGGMGRGAWGYTDAMGNQVSAGMDMIDGGGRGMAGDTFQGGPFSGLLNALGVRPRGYNARQEAMAAEPDTTASYVTPAPAPTANIPASTVTNPSFSNYILTELDIERLNRLGIDTPAVAGEQANAEELTALLTNPIAPSASQRIGFIPTPAAPVPATRNPALLPRATPDIALLERYLSGQPNAMTEGPTQLNANVLNNPSITMPQSDIGTARPYVSRSTGRISPLLDVLPLVDSSNPPPPPIGFATPPSAGVRAANRGYIEMQRRAAERGNPILPMLLPNR